ncbi:hypothetical protein D3C76_711470 [compost metagenome]
MEPDKGGERADRCDLRAEVGADDVGVDQRFADRARGGGFGDAKHAGHDGRQVVHDRRQERRDVTHGHRGHEQALIRRRLDEIRQDLGQTGIPKAVHNDVHPDRENDDVPWRAFHDGLRVDRLAPTGNRPEDQGHCIGKQGHREMKKLARQVSDQQDPHHYPGQAE